MQTLTKFDKVVIEDYYHMTTMVKNVNWIKQTHLLLIFPLILRPLFVHLPLHQKFFNTLFKFTQYELYLFLMCTSMYTNASNNTPSYTRFRLDMV